jgi:hypothetical protein
MIRSGTIGTISRSSRLHQPQWLSGALHFLILYIAVEAESRAVWPYALLAMAAVSFFAWAANYRRYRQINDLPTSRVASAAQGYVELFGRAEPLPGEPVLSRVSRVPCCWYSYHIEERTSDNKWHTVDRGESVDQFLLIDKSGQCVISPEGAEVLSGKHSSWQEGDRRFSEDLVLPASALYAIGEFSTSTAAPPSARDERADVGAMLAEWKADQKALRERFDLNRDGTVDVKEWELARLQALREVRRRQSQAQPVEGVHLLRKPGDGRLFLLANEFPDRLGARYRFWSWVHLLVFVGGGTAGLLML